TQNIDPWTTPVVAEGPAAAVEAAYATGMPILDHGKQVAIMKDGSVIPITDPRFKREKSFAASGAGSGANSAIHFSPELFPGPYTFPGSKPDEMLFHETVHAFRQVSGSEHPWPVNQGYDDLEDYYAVVIANMYLSSKGKTVLRASHSTTGELREPAKWIDN